MNVVKRKEKNKDRFCDYVQQTTEANKRLNESDQYNKQLTLQAFPRSVIKFIILGFLFGKKNREPNACAEETNSRQYRVVEHFLPSDTAERLEGKNRSESHSP